MKTREFFDRHPVFTLEELDRFLAGERSTNRATRNSLLSYYRRRGRIISIRRGLYAVVPTGTSPESGPVDPYLLAGKLTSDTVLAYHTALEFHGRAYSVYRRLFYLSANRLPPVRFRTYEFRCVSKPQALRDKGKEDFGVVQDERSGIDLKVTGLERTLVDVLDRPDLSGSWEEIWRSLETVEFFDLERVIEYTLLLGNATTTAKVGFYLEQHRDSLMVEDSHLQLLRMHKPRQPHYLERSKRESGRLVKDWNLVIPVELLERSWEEVL